MNELLYTATEFATKTNIPVRTITQWLAVGKLTGVKRGPIWMIPGSEVIRVQEIAMEPGGKGKTLVENLTLDDALPTTAIPMTATSLPMPTTATPASARPDQLDFDRCYALCLVSRPSLSRSTFDKWLAVHGYTKVFADAKFNFHHNRKISKQVLALFMRCLVNATLEDHERESFTNFDLLDELAAYIHDTFEQLQDADPTFDRATFESLLASPTGDVQMLAILHRARVKAKDSVTRTLDDPILEFASGHTLPRAADEEDEDAKFFTSGDGDQY